MSFTERKIVNGSSLRQFGGQNVSIFVNVEPQAERNANEFTGKTSDDVTVKVILDERLNVELHGWVEVIGQVQSAATIVSKEIILFPNEGDQEPFDTNAHNQLVTFIHNCSDLLAV